MKMLSMYLHAAMAALTALALTVSPGLAQHGDDLQLSHDGARLEIVEPDEITDDNILELEFEELIPGLLWGVELGFEIFHSNGLPTLQRAMVQQRWIAPGLFGTIEGEIDPIFGDGLPGSLLLDQNRDHAHVVFTTTQLGEKWFRFRLEGGIAADGTRLFDSKDYWIAIAPEPASMFALATGLGGLALARRRLNRK